MTHTFTLPTVTLSQNQLDGKHWSVKQEQKVHWHSLVSYLIGTNPQQPTKARVSIVRVSKRLIDPLNVPAGCKWLLDALVNMHWLKDDSYKWCTVSTEQRKCTKGEEPHMEITIEYES